LGSLANPSRDGGRALGPRERRICRELKFSRTKLLGFERLHTVLGFTPVCGGCFGVKPCPREPLPLFVERARGRDLMPAAERRIPGCVRRQRQECVACAAECTRRLGESVRSLVRVGFGLKRRRCIVESIRT
jgi:hypothetical protein